jgi:CBS domain-containing protein
LLAGSSDQAITAEVWPMRAVELAEPFPIVDVDTDAMLAARELVARRLPGLIVCREDGSPWTVLPGSQVLRFLIPAYLQDDFALARALDERGAEELVTKLNDATVRDLLPRPQDVDELPVVDPDATALEVAAVMARMHSPLVAVMEGGRVVGAITISRVLRVLLGDERA